MKLPEWFMGPYRNDKKGLILACLIGGPVLSIATYFADKHSSSWWAAWAGAWGFFIVIVLPALYISRPKKK